MSGKSLGFLELFPGCSGLAGMCGGLDKATVQGAVVKEDEYTMSVSATSVSYTHLRGLSGERLPQLRRARRDRARRDALRRGL